MTSSPRTLALATVLLLPLVASTATGRRGPTATQAPASYTYQGTVHSVDSRARALDVITGVGMALRLVHMGTDAATRIAGAGASLALTDLQPGDVVRAECHRTAAGLVADRIEKLVEVTR